MLNSDLVAGIAQTFAGRVLNDSGLKPEDQVDRAFRLAFGRGANPEEQKIADDFLATQAPIMQVRLANDQSRPPMPTNLPAGMDPARAAAFVDLCRMLLDSNEYLYIN
jgi:hypothetical protein